MVTRRVTSSSTSMDSPLKATRGAKLCLKVYMGRFKRTNASYNKTSAELSVSIKTRFTGCFAIVIETTICSLFGLWTLTKSLPRKETSFVSSSIFCLLRGWFVPLEIMLTSRPIESRSRRLTMRSVGRLSIGGSIGSFPFSDGPGLLTYLPR